MNSAQKKYILFQNGGIGDFLMAIFLSEQLKKHGNVEEIFIIVHHRRELLEQFLGCYPYINLIEVSAKQPKSFLKVRKLIGGNNVVVFPPTIGAFPLRLKLFARILAGYRGFLLGFSDNGFFNQFLFSKTLPYKLDQDFTETMRDIVRVLGFPVSKEEPRLEIGEKKEGLNRLGLGAPYVVFHPHGAAERRRLSREESVEIVNCIHALNSTVEVVVSGAKDEHDLIEEIVRMVDTKSRVKIAVGFSIQELSTLIRGSILFIGMDTGITHLACFLGGRVLVIAKNATANWLPYYHSRATILYRLAEEDETRSDQAYLLVHQKERIRPFQNVPVKDICSEIKTLVS